MTISYICLGTYWRHTESEVLRLFGVYVGLAWGRKIDNRKVI